MVEPKAWFAGVDWASEAHHVCVVGGDGSKRDERIFRHGGAGLAEMVEWIAAKSGGSAPDIPVAIEVPHGPVVESLMDRGFAVYAINPKQLDRFRDRFSPAGAKDDSLDARVLADALRTDLHHFRRIDPVDPAVIELRAWSRIAEELTRDRVRLSNRVREQLWRYYPQILEAVGSVVEPWFLDLWAKAPTPAKARRVQRRTLESLLKRHRIRRITADQLQETLRAPAIAVAPGTTEAAVAHNPKRLRTPPPRTAPARRRQAGNRPPDRRPGRQRGLRLRPTRRAARRDGPLLPARSRPDRHRHAARRGPASAGAPGLQGAAVSHRRRARHTAIRQVQARRAPHGRPRPPSRRSLPLGTGCGPARSRQQGQVRRPSRPRPCPRPPLRRGPPARGRLRHAQNSDLLPAYMPGGGKCGLISPLDAGLQPRLKKR